MIFMPILMSFIRRPFGRRSVGVGSRMGRLRIEFIYGLDRYVSSPFFVELHQEIGMDLTVFETDNPLFENDRGSEIRGL